MFLIYFTDFLKYALETLLTTACFLGGMERKKHFRLWSRAFLLGTVGISVLLAVVASNFAMGDYGLFAAGVYTVFTLLPVCFVFACYKETFWNRLFSCVSGITLRMCAKKIFDIALVAWELSGLDLALVEKGRLLRELVYYPIFSLCCALAWWLFRKTFRAGSGFSMNAKTSMVYLLVLSSNIVLNNIEPLLRTVSLHAYGLLLFCEFAYYALILCMQAFLFQIAQKETENHVTQELWRQDRRQYEQIKENIEIVNIKCHDLRHQLRAAQESGRVDEGFLREVERSISIYDSSVKSGNETLDVILTDKRLHCEAAGILADGRKLEFMERSDIISLFSNLLENAMEYEATIDEQEKRFISVTVRTVERFLDIHVENYFEDTLELRDGLPVTAKTDKTSHGYGLKSIRRIVEKYGGTMKLEVADDMFQVSILLPVGGEVTG